MFVSKAAKFERFYAIVVLPSEKLAIHYGKTDHWAKLAVLVGWESDLLFVVLL
jgi:hypothetical protein